MTEVELDFSIPTMDDDPLTEESGSSHLQADPVITITMGDDPTISGVLTSIPPPSTIDSTASTSSSSSTSSTSSSSNSSSSSTSTSTISSSSLSHSPRHPASAIADLVVPALLSSGVTQMAQGVLGSIRKDGIKQIRPWNEFFSTQHLAVPTPRQAVARVPANLRYFQANYLFVFLALALYSVITSPSLLVLAVAMGLFSVYLLYWRQEPIVLFGWTVSDQHRVAMLLALSLLLCIFTSAASTLLWIGAFALVATMLHSIFWNPEEVDLFTTP